MKYLLPILFLFVTLNNVSAQDKMTMSYDTLVGSPEASITDIDWISGHWRGEAFGGFTEEIWGPPVVGVMMGMFRHIDGRKQEITFYELMTIEEIQGTLLLKIRHFDKLLHAWEEKQQPLIFHLVKVEEDKVHFDNLTFEKISEDEINVYVVIEENEGEPDEVTFNYKRVVEEEQPEDK